MSQSLTERYDERIAGMLSCYDRLVITGTLPVICYAAGMTGYLNAKGIRIFDYPEFAKTLRDRVRDRAATLAAEAGITIEHIAKPHVRKEDVVARVLRQRGDHSGLVHIISAMEACDAYKPWHDKQTHKTFMRPDSGKCLHYYFYFMDAKLGLIYLRVPTWAPFRLQFYCNGRWCTRRMGFEMTPVPVRHAMTRGQRMDFGRPAASIRFRTATPIAPSVCWAAKPRARSRGPISVL